MTITELIIHRPDDMHLHLRDGEMLNAVVTYSSADFGRAIIMPNLVPPVVNVSMARAYRDRILSAIGEDHQFEPLMTLYLTESTTPAEIALAAKDGLIKAVKLYPAGATTNSESGVRDISVVMPVLEKMAEVGLPLLLHGEVTDADIDIFDREAVFIDRVSDPLRTQLPELRIVMEHVTTEVGVQFVKSSSENLFATLTTHHLIINRNAMLVGGIRPHYYCLPVAKREKHRLALRAAAVSDDSRFFLGTDSAPHLDAAKETASGCAGIFTSVNTLGCLATVFEQENALDKLEAFTSLNGAAFYGLAPNPQKTKLVKKANPVEYPKTIQIGQETLTIFDPRFPIYWHVEPNTPQ
jgi:dihydroorotase